MCEIMDISVGKPLFFGTFNRFPQSKTVQSNTTLIHFRNRLINLSVCECVIMDNRVKGKKYANNSKSKSHMLMFVLFLFAINLFNHHHLFVCVYCTIELQMRIRVYVRM